MLSEHEYRHLILFLRSMTYLRVQFVYSERSTMIPSILKEAATRRNGWNQLVSVRKPYSLITPTPPLGKLLRKENHLRSYCTITMVPQPSGFGVITPTSSSIMLKNLAHQSLTRFHSDPNRSTIGSLRSRSVGRLRLLRRKPRKLMQVKELHAKHPGMRMM